MKKFKAYCPSCGKDYEYDFTDSQFEELDKEPSKQRLPFYMREIQITGLCYGCQSKTFHVSTPGYDLGTKVSECDCCGANVYESDIEKGVCAVCHTPLTDNED